MRKLILTVLVLCAAAAVTGCGISKQTKQLTGEVIGYNGLMDEYMTISTMVIENHLAVIKQFEAQHPDLTLSAKDSEGKDVAVPIAKYREALEVLLTYPENFKKAYHAVNDAVQADTGFSAFTEQLLRTLSADKFWDVITPR